VSARANSIGDSLLSNSAKEQQSEGMPILWTAYA
jgi:hypothetical protein